jgi:hypothetical protein
MRTEQTVEARNVRAGTDKLIRDGIARTVLSVDTNRGKTRIVTTGGNAYDLVGTRKVKVLR